MARSKANSKVKLPPLSFTADEIVLRKVDDLVPFPNNPKQHSAEQISALAANIKAFGFDQPILIDETDTILKGHGRQLAARKAGRDMVPTIVRPGLSLAQKWAIVISDNALPAMTGFDQSLLRIGMTTLAKADFDLKLTGFDNVRLATFGVGVLAGSGKDPDEEIEPEAKPISKLGDIWILGSHRIICGDSTDAKTVKALLGDDEPHLMVTDQPYGVAYEPTWRDERAKKSPTMGNRKDTASGVVQNDDQADWRKVWDLFPGDVAYVWCASLTNDIAIDGLESSGLDRRSLIVWAKQHLVIGRSDYHWQHELCWYVVRKGKTGHWNGDRKQTTVWSIDKPQKSETGHSTQKPIECMKRPIENNSKQGDSIYEPFAGSGTTIIAAEMTGRVCLAIELSPLYVDVCVRRWEKFSSRKAVLQGTKKTFDQIEKERSKKVA